MNKLIIKGAREHNLKNIDLELGKIPYDVFSQVFIYVSMAGNTLFKSSSRVFIYIVFFSVLHEYTT